MVRQGPFQDAVNFGDFVILAVGWSNIESVLGMISPDSTVEKPLSMLQTYYI